MFYRPPNSSPFVIDSLFTILCNLNVSLFSNFYLIGDFNIDYFCTSHPLYCNLTSVVSSFNLTQVVSEPTHITNSSATLIDLIFASSPFQVESCSTIPPLANSDHNGLQLTISVKSSKRAVKGVPRRIWKYSLADFDSMADYLESIDWNLVLVGNINNCWENWKNCFLRIMDMSIPNSTVITNRRLPWINHTIIQAMRKRKVLFDTYKRTKMKTDRAKYQAQRNRVVTLLRESKEDFFRKLHNTNAKEFWKAIRKLNAKQSIIPTLTDGVSMADTSQDKATLLNNFFFTCFNWQCPPLTPDQLGSSDHELNPLGFPQELLCSEDSVAELLISLDPSKSSGVDGISAKMLRSAAYSIASSLTNLFNQSLTTGIYPKEWKLARIVPVPKSDCPGTSVTGYRPISILSIVSKVLERHVKDTIDEFLTQTHPISDCQWGFMHHRSSVSALIAVIHDWLSALDSGHEVCVVFFDVKKAFDSVPHVPLLEKLSEIGLNPYIIRWIKSYLTDREQFVVVDGASSDPLQVLSGVPQGSVLGPLLFVIYINDVVQQISNGSRISLFADDIAQYRIIHTPNDYVSLQSDINAVSTCLASKYWNLNVTKCCCLLLSRKRTQSIPIPTLTLNGASLAQVSSYKYLGVLITSNLMWSSHVTTICNKTRRLVGIFYRQFYKHSSQDTMLHLYTSFIRPHLEYATAAWDPFLMKDIELLENVQKFALRVCTKSWDSNYSSLLEISHLPSLQTRRLHTKLCNLFKITNGLTFHPNAPTLNRVLHYPSRTVHSQAIVPLQYHTLQFQNSFFPSSIAAWNSLPPVTVSNSTLPSFKRALKS